MESQWLSPYCLVKSSKRNPYKFPLLDVPKTGKILAISLIVTHTFKRVQIFTTSNCSFFYISNYLIHMQQYICLWNVLWQVYFECPVDPMFSRLTSVTFINKSEINEVNLTITSNTLLSIKCSTIMFDKVLSIEKMSTYFTTVHLSMKHLKIYLYLDFFQQNSKFIVNRLIPISFCSHSPHPVEYTLSLWCITRLMRLGSHELPLHTQKNTWKIIIVLLQQDWLTAK